MAKERKSVARFTRSCLVLAGLASLVVLPPRTYASEALQYLDDRSTPQKLIQSYYNAINKKQYARAYGYFTKGSAPSDFESWSEGYAKTKSVSVQFGSTRPDPGAGQIYWALPVAISSLDTDGKTEVFAGCYKIHLTNPGMQVDPPFQPMSIDGAKLEASTKRIAEAVPDKC